MAIAGGMRILPEGDVRATAMAGDTGFRDGAEESDRILPSTAARTECHRMGFGVVKDVGYLSEQRSLAQRDRGMC